MAGFGAGPGAVVLVGEAGADALYCEAGGAAGDGGLLPFVTVPGAIDLLESFASISDARGRRLVCDMARLLAQRPPIDEAEPLAAG